MATINALCEAGWILTGAALVEGLCRRNCYRARIYIRVICSFFSAKYMFNRMTADVFEFGLFFFKAVIGYGAIECSCVYDSFNVMNNLCKLARK